MRKMALVLAVLLCLAVTAPVFAAAPLRDVDMSSARGRAIQQMVSAGYISRYQDGTFRPDAPVSALDYITMISKAKGIRDSGAGSMRAALNEGWFSQEEIPIEQAGAQNNPVSRELAASIIVKAFFGTIDYPWSITASITDMDDLNGEYYAGVFGGLYLGIFDHTSGTAFYPWTDLTRGEACLWTANAMAQELPDPTPSPAPTLQPSTSTAPLPLPTSSVPDVAPVMGGVSDNGWLQVAGTQLCNQDGNPIVLHGMSSMGIQWYPQYTNYQSIMNTKSRGANVFRIAMYTAEGGYLSNKPKFKALVEQIVQNAIRADMYVIIDWHNLFDGNPMDNVDESAAFFNEMSAKYANVPNVIYEICNEPNGNITWEKDVKPYAERITGVIHKNSPHSIILIGNPRWTQDILSAAQDPVDGYNLMYTLHFYAGTHGSELRDRAQVALQLGTPLFITEWGVSQADGDGGVYLESADEWMQFLNRHKVSWCNWSLCDASVTSAALKPGTSPNTRWTDANLTESGRYVFTRFADTAANPPQEDGVITPVTAQEVANSFDNPSSVHIFKDGKQLTGANVVSTGSEVAVIASGQEVWRATIVVLGDLVGNGIITLSDIVLTAGAMRGDITLSSLQLKAAEFNGVQGVNLADLVYEVNIFRHGGKLQYDFTDEGRAFSLNSDNTEHTSMGYA